MILAISEKIKDANGTVYLIKATRKNKRMKGRIEWLCVREKDNQEMWCPEEIMNKMEDEGKLSLVRKRGRPKK
ncbi:helicase-primase primase subunit [Ochrobactrum phage vB_OspM_OC]|nr:helicase-primase primase subunit [Ochrobactrum phage vB_OspM_OC]